MLSLRLLYNRLKHSQRATKDGGAFCIPFNPGPQVTSQFHPREREGKLPGRWGWEFCLASTIGFSCLIRVLHQLCFPCHERSAARQLNQTLHHWLFLRVLYSTSAIRPSRCKGFSLHWLYTDSVLQAQFTIDTLQSFTTTLRRIMHCMSIDCLVMDKWCI